MVCNNDNGIEPRMSSTTRETLNYAMIKSLKEIIDEFKKNNKEEHRAFLSAIKEVSGRQAGIEGQLDTHCSLSVVKEFNKEQRSKEWFIRILLWFLGAGATAIVSLVVALVTGMRG